jgi:predicted PurR-regulated permease PerM
LFYPIYKILIFKTKQRENISSLITLLLIVSTIILPLVFTTYLFTKETLEVTKNISVKSIENSISAISEKESFDNTLISFGLDPAEVKNSVADFTKNTLKKIGSSSIEFGKSTLNIILNFFIMLYLIFFFLKDGKNMLYRISEILPMGNSIEKEIFVRFSTIVRSIFKGTMIIAVVQGLIGGMLFFTVGIESALL